MASGRRHDIVEDAELDPRCGTFWEIFNGSTDHVFKADILSLWICTRSTHLMLAYRDLRREGIVNSNIEFRSSTCPLLLPFEEVAVHFDDGTNRRKGVETTIFWKVLMPPESRDMSVNRASDNPAPPICFFRLSAKFLEMRGSFV